MANEGATYSIGRAPMSGRGDVDPEVYKDFGRDTEAGKLIYNLYNSSANARKNYKPNVRVRPKRTAAIGLTPDQEHKLKQRARYEEVRMRKSHGAAAPSLPVSALAAGVLGDARRRPAAHAPDPTPSRPSRDPRGTSTGARRRPRKLTGRMP